jgi:hypothetical protein
MLLPSTCIEQCMTRSLIVALAALAMPCGARAALGEPWVAATQTPGKSLLLTAPAAAGAQYTLHESVTTEGAWVREFTDSAGVVFAVTWFGAFKPDLQQLLGRYFGAFRDAPRAVSGASARGTLRIRGDGVVVDTGGRPRAFFGRAWVPALLPAGVDMPALP